MTASSLAELKKQIDELRQIVEMLPDYGAALAETRKSYAVDSAVVHLAGTETISGAKTFSSTVAGAKFQTSTATVSANSGVATTILTLPSAAPAVYLVSANIGVTIDAANYGAFAIVFSDTTSARMFSNNNGALHTLTISGLDIKSTQSSGAPQPVTVTVTKIG